MVEHKPEANTPKFNAVMYSLDSFVPLINLGQAKYRYPTGAFLRTYLWVHILAGWTLSTLLAVGLPSPARKPSGRRSWMLPHNISRSMDIRPPAWRTSPGS